MPEITDPNELMHLQRQTGGVTGPDPVHDQPPTPIAGPIERGITQAFTKGAHYGTGGLVPDQEETPEMRGLNPGVRWGASRAGNIAPTAVMGPIGRGLLAFGPRAMGWFSGTTGKNLVGEGIQSGGEMFGKGLDYLADALPESPAISGGLRFAGGAARSAGRAGKEIFNRKAFVQNLHEAEEESENLSSPLERKAAETPTGSTQLGPGPKSTIITPENDPDTYYGR
jgi:hypothetical protein